MFVFSCFSVFRDAGAKFDLQKLTAKDLSLRRGMILRQGVLISSFGMLISSCVMRVVATLSLRMMNASILVLLFLTWVGRCAPGLIPFAWLSLLRLNTSMTSDSQAYFVRALGRLWVPKIFSLASVNFVFFTYVISAAFLLQADMADTCILRYFGYLL